MGVKWVRQKVTLRPFARISKLFVCFTVGRPRIVGIQLQDAHSEPRDGTAEDVLLFQIYFRF